MSDLLITIVVFGSLLLALRMILYRPAAFRKYMEKMDKEEGRMSRQELLRQIDQLEKRIDYLNATIEEERGKKYGH
ncbi:MAG: hypothetical protein K5634_01185 [Sphaerochaetaceae bacterium]|nr:hypothetical protein [Sphaerochaetaceae bacterium]